MKNLWLSDNPQQWHEVLQGYEHVVTQQGVARLPELDSWYHHELPDNMRTRKAPHITHHEMVRITEWKMARGVWRAPNLVLVRGNDVALVVSTSTEALHAIPHPTKPIATLATLAGVGPATASAVAAAFAPHLYPFFDELVAAQVPALGKVAWTMGYYGKYASALRERAGALGDVWTAAMVERALWTYVGGKTGAAASA